MSRLHLILVERHCQERSPAAIGQLISYLLHFFRVLLKTTKPMPHGVQIVFFEILHVAHLEASCLCCLKHSTDRYRRLGIREYVAMNEVAPEDKTCGGVDADAMVEEDTPRTELFPHRFVVGW